MGIFYTPTEPPCTPSRDKCSERPNSCQPTYFATIGANTVTAYVDSIDNKNKDVTRSYSIGNPSGCVGLPLKSGGKLPVGWTRLAGALPGTIAFTDTWQPAGVSGIFSFLPLVNTYAQPAGGRHRWSDRGSLTYSSTLAPENDVEYAALATTTYFTEYDVPNQVYYEYFAGTSLSSSDKRYGRLNRRYDRVGNELLYHYEDNAAGKPLLRRITGFGGAVVPYFFYADEAVSSPTWAPITNVQIRDQAAPDQSRSIYFEYSVLSGNPYLTKIVNPDGCVTMYEPNTTWDVWHTYIMAREVDAEGYTTYFSGQFNMTDSTEPGGRSRTYGYGTLKTASALQGKNNHWYLYSLNSLARSARVTGDHDELGQTTYFDYDSTIGRMVRKVRPNLDITYYEWIGGSNLNKYALSAETSTLNGARKSYFYDGQTYNLATEVGPRHVPGTFPVFTYYAYDSSQNLIRTVDALGRAKHYGRDAIGRISREQDALGRTTYFNYSSDTGFLDSQVDSAGGATYFGYSSFGPMLRQVSSRWPEASFQAFTTYWEYDKRDRKRKAIDPLGNVSYFDWTSRGNLLASVDAHGSTTAYAYDGLGLLTQQTVTDSSGSELTSTKHAYDIYKNRVRTLDALGHATYFNYDQINRLTATQNALLQTTYYSYDTVSNREVVTDALNNSTYSFHDSLSRLTCSKDAVGNSSYFSYDLANNRTLEVNPRGNLTYFFYDALDRLETTRDALGNATYFYFDEVGNRIAVRDARFNSTYFFYDSRNLSTVTRNALGVTTYHGYDAGGNLVRALNERLNATYFFFDSLDRVSAQRDAVGGTTYFYYDAVGNRSIQLDPRANTTYFFFDGLNRKTVARNALAEATYFFYDAGSNKTHEVDARGNTTYFFYDALDRVSVRRDASANAGYFFYDAVGNLAVTRNARGVATYFFYDAINRETTRLDAAGNSSYFFYDAAGNRTCIRNRRGVSTYFTFDALNRLSAVLLPEDTQTARFYDAVGNLVAARDKAARATGGFGAQAYGTSSYGGWQPADSLLSYDALNRLAANRDPLGNSSYFFYDATNNRTVALNPAVHASYFGYDAMNRLVRTQDSLGGTTYFAFDISGNLTETIDANGNAVLSRFDTLNRPDAIRQADGGSAYFFYDRTSNKTKDLDAQGNATYYAYDVLNRKTAMQDQQGRTLYFEYDAVGNLSKFIDAERASSAHTYDALDRRTQTTYTPAGTVIAYGLRSDPYYIYDKEDNLAQMGDLWGLHLFGYDGLNRAVSHVFPRGQVVYYEYTPRSDRSRITYPGSSGASTIDYDLLNRSIKVVSPSGTGVYFSYDAASNLILKVLGNGARQHMSYDAAERVNRWRTSDKTGAPLTYFDYTRDAKGLITKCVRETTHIIYYSYDASDRLLSEVWTKSPNAEVYGYRYAYDLAGNRTRVRMNGADTYYFYDNVNQLTVRGTNAVYASPTYYFYDQNGSVTAIKQPTRTSYFAYNAAGLIARIRWGDASSTYFLYDGNLQRYGIQMGTTSLTTTYFLWDGLTLLQELNADGTVKEENTHAKTPIEGLGTMLEINRPGQSPQKIFPVMDPRGTITKQLLSDGTTVQAAQEYNAFGQTIPGSTTGTWIGNYTYQGQAWMVIQSADVLESKLLSLTRIYDEETGRFLQNEPLLEDRPREHYLYCDQNPVMFVDPTGLQQPAGGWTNPYGLGGGTSSGGWTNYGPGRPPGGPPSAPPPVPQAPPPPQAPANPDLPSPRGQKRVWICHRVPNICGGELAASVGKEHQWLKTDEFEVGMGPAAGGVPGNQSDCPCTDTTMNPHTGESQKPGVTCDLVVGVDYDCVNSYLKAGTATGRWVPLCNDCNTEVDTILRKCRPRQDYQVDLWGIYPPKPIGGSYVIYSDGTKKPPGNLTTPWIVYPPSYR